MQEKKRFEAMRKYRDSCMGLSVPACILAGSLYLKDNEKDY